MYGAVPHDTEPYRALYSNLGLCVVWCLCVRLHRLCLEPTHTQSPISVLCVCLVYGAVPHDTGPYTECLGLCRVQSTQSPRMPCIGLCRALWSLNDTDQYPNPCCELVLTERLYLCVVYNPSFFRRLILPDPASLT